MELTKKEKELLILNFLYMVITDNRNCNRYFSTRLGNIIKDKTVGLSDCIKYLEDKLNDI